MSYGQYEINVHVLEALGEQHVTLGRTYHHMLGFIRNTLITNLFGYRSHILMMKKHTQSFVIVPLLIRTSIKKTNLGQNCPYDRLEHDISSLRKEENIILIADFNY